MFCINFIVFFPILNFFSSLDSSEWYDNFRLFPKKIDSIYWFLFFFSKFSSSLLWTLHHRCHGENGNVIYEMAKGKDLLSSDIPTYKTYNFIRSNGEVIPEKVSDRLTKLAMGILDRGEHREEKLAYHGSLGNYFAQKWVLVNQISFELIILLVKSSISGQVLPKQWFVSLKAKTNRNRFWF